MNALKTLENRLRGWIPNDYRIAFGQKVSKPFWWKPLWITAVVANIAWILLALFVFYLPLERVVIVAVVASIAVGFAYYIRVRPSMNVNRAVYVLLGITPIGLCLSLLWNYTIGYYTAPLIGLWGFYIGIMVPCIIGAFIGDWIGKKRNYLLPLSI
jgi:hypothetical protein